jgi:hypothetical protein
MRGRKRIMKRIGSKDLPTHVSSSLKIEAVGSSEMLVPIYKTAVKPRLKVSLGTSHVP